MKKEEQLKLLYRKRDCLLEAREINNTLLEDYSKQNIELLQEMYPLMRMKSNLGSYDEEIQEANKQGMYRILGITSVATVVSSLFHSGFVDVAKYWGINLLIFTGVEFGLHAMENYYLKRKMPHGDLEQFELQYYDTDEKLKGVNCGLNYLYEKSKQLNISLAEHDYGSFSKQNSNKEKIKR